MWAELDKTSGHDCTQVHVGMHPHARMHTHASKLEEAQCCCFCLFACLTGNARNTGRWWRHWIAGTNGTIPTHSVIRSKNLTQKNSVWNLSVPILLTFSPPSPSINAPVSVRFCYKCRVWCAYPLIVLSQPQGLPGLRGEKGEPGGVGDRVSKRTLSYARPLVASDCLWSGSNTIKREQFNCWQESQLCNTMDLKTLFSWLLGQAQGAVLFVVSFVVKLLTSLLFFVVL